MASRIEKLADQIIKLSPEEAQKLGLIMKAKMLPEIAKKQASGVLASGGKSGLSDTFKNIGWMYGSSPSKAVDESTGNLSAEVFRSGNQVQTNLADAGQKTLGSYIQSGYTKYKPVANRLMTDVYIRNYFNQMGAEDFYSPNYSGGVQGDFS